MVPLDFPDLIPITRLLRDYDRESTISLLAGLLTVPSLQANTMRIESVVHLAVAHCAGSRRPRRSEIGDWLNAGFKYSQIKSMEDSADDVFVTNVETPYGNRRIFEGDWKANSYFVQVVIDTLVSRSAPKVCSDLLVAVFALLRLSDQVAERVRLRRWHVEDSLPAREITLPPDLFPYRARSVTFTNEDLHLLGVTKEALVPFTLPETAIQNLAIETLGHTSLERYPVVDFGTSLVLVLPPAISPAIRRFVLSELQDCGYLEAFARALQIRQANEVERDCLRGQKGPSEFIRSPPAKSMAPAMNEWLLKFDVGKYLHVILLHDSMHRANADGLNSFLQYPDDAMETLEQHIKSVAGRFHESKGFSEGWTLLVVGGIGRSFVLGITEFPDSWHLSAIRISDFVMLSHEPQRPLVSFLKFIAQKELIEKRGLRLAGINTDYNTYCYWVHNGYRLVLHEMSLNAKTTLLIGNECMLPVRRRVRSSSDRHALQMKSGLYCSVRRLTTDAFFECLNNRPVYVSLNHLDTRILAGAVETERGPSWLLVETQADDPQTWSFVYQLWSGFLELFYRLVMEIECRFPNTRTGPMEIQLDFNQVVISEDYTKIPRANQRSSTQLELNLDQRSVVVKLPPDLLLHFQQPENTGEKLVLRAMAHGLVSLHRQRTIECEDTLLNVLTNKVIDSPGSRVLHVFRIYNPIEKLLAQGAGDQVFLAPEDFAFSKLGLSDGVNEVSAGDRITSKPQCSCFLNRLVDKIWLSLRELLHQFNRRSVVSSMLKVHESAIQDRDHWHRTAQANLALYSHTTDVFATAQERESERTNVQLPARTILEMAICECPAVGGRELSRWDLDNLLAKARLLLEVATDSDAIYHEVTEPRIELYRNGEYTIDRQFHETVLKPFIMARSRDEYEEASREYNTLYQRDMQTRQTKNEDQFSKDFVDAFRSEYNLTPGELIQGVSELADWAVELGRVIVETTLDELKTRLTDVRHLSREASNAFVLSFALFSRPSWDKPPPGFTKKDIFPWRYSRRLSVVARPMIVYGEQYADEVMFGVGTLFSGIVHLLNGASEGRITQDFFVTPQMRQYLGAVNHERGHAFTRLIEHRMRRQGWQVRSLVEMTKMGGRKDLGDIDVLAWKPNGKIRIIECKRLQFARTVAEVSELCKRFRGEAKDDLRKHVQRVTWIKENPAGLRHIIGFSANPKDIDDRLVTNVHVPMTYLESLPIDPRKIGPL